MLARMEEVMKRSVIVFVIFILTAWTSLAFAGESKMIGTVSAIKILGSNAELVMKDRKTEAKVVLQVRDASTMEKIKDKKIRVGDELRIRFDEGSKVVRNVLKTAGC